MNYNEDDRRFMELALMEARTAFDMDEVPVGAVVVNKGRVIGRSQYARGQISARQYSVCHRRTVCHVCRSHRVEPDKTHSGGRI